MSKASSCAWTGILVALGAGSASGQSTTCVSVDSAGVQGNAGSSGPSISADGRWVVFSSDATNLVSGDTNAKTDIFVHDLQTGVTERVSVDSSGAQGNGRSQTPSISADGRFVAFVSSSINLVAGDTNATDDAFVHDRQTGATERVSSSSAGVQGNGQSLYTSISADGRYVAFMSSASNLVAGDTNLRSDVFVRDRQAGQTLRASVDSAGVQGNSNCTIPAISADGLRVAFISDASNLVPLDWNGLNDVFVHDFTSGSTTRVSVGPGGAQANGTNYFLCISADGRFVGFSSFASNLVAGDSNGWVDVFVHEIQSGVTTRVSVDSLGLQPDAVSLVPSLSADGRYAAFDSRATNLVAGDTNGVWDIFVHDCLRGPTSRVSVDSAGAQANASCNGTSISADGRFIAFGSNASNLVPLDTNGMTDVFVRDLGPVYQATDLCQPGSGGVIACPCSNPPAGAPRGCDNSSATGGAQLASSGSVSLAFDTLVFVTNGEKPTATSVLLQGDAEASAGFVFGQGVRCTGGALKRLYMKSALGGSILAPGFGDPSVSARSAALGDPIGAGTNRWYAVYYRDPVVLGGCSAMSTFDITQTQLVAWSP